MWLVQHQSNEEDLWVTTKRFLMHRDVNIEEDRVFHRIDEEEIQLLHVEVLNWLNEAILIDLDGKDQVNFVPMLMKKEQN